ncbi:MAG TPA: hypothetical protein PK413_04975, partial [Thermoanaerobaculia bacterium]|nr:hypothetical protein [Thermoanaerobaculia bacterium]
MSDATGCIWFVLVVLGVAVGYLLERLRTGQRQLRDQLEQVDQRLGHLETWLARATERPKEPAVQPRPDSAEKAPRPILAAQPRPAAFAVA